MVDAIELIYGIQISKDIIPDNYDMGNYIDEFLENICREKVLTMRYGHTKEQSIISSIPMDVVNIISKKAYNECMNDIDSNI